MADSDGEDCSNSSIVKPSDVPFVFKSLFQIVCIFIIILSFVVLFTLRRSSHFLRFIVRFAIGHHIVITMLQSMFVVTGLTLSDQSYFVSEQLFSWMLTIRWQDELTLLFLVIVSQFDLLEYDRGILFLVSSWAFASTPSLAVQLQTEGSGKCMHQNFWNPLINRTVPDSLIMIVPLLTFQVSTLAWCMYCLLGWVRHRTKLQPLNTTHTQECRVCERNIRHENSKVLVCRIIISVAVYNVPLDISQILGLKSDPKDIKSIAWMYFPLTGAFSIVDSLVILYTIVRLVTFHKMFCSEHKPRRFQKQKHSSGGSSKDPGGGDTSTLNSRNLDNRIILCAEHSTQSERIFSQRRSSVEFNVCTKSTDKEDCHASDLDSARRVSSSVNTNKHVTIQEENG